MLMLQQEMFRAWALFYPEGTYESLRGAPKDERNTCLQSLPSIRNVRTQPLVLTSLQKSILEALNGKALNKDDLGRACKVDPSLFYRPGGIKELRDRHKVEHKHGVGYYRPDAPPPDAIQ